MGTISDKLTYLNTTKTNLKDMINYGLPSEEQITSSTTFRNYVSSIFEAFLESLRDSETLYTNLPKTSGSGSQITLNGTANAPMRITLNPTAISQDGTPTPDSPQDIHTISGNNSIVVSDGNGVSQTNTIDLTPYNLGSIGNYENKFIRSGGENLLLNTLLTTATTKNGITATPNNDGSVSLSGTSTATTYFNLTNTDFGTTSFNSVYGGSTEYVANTGNTNTNIRIAYDSGNKYTYIQVNNATTTNVTIFPMINKGTTALPYVPYEKGWYYKEGIGKVVLDGSDTGIQSISSYDQVLSYTGEGISYQVSFSNLLTAKSSTEQLVISNYFNKAILNDRTTKTNIIYTYTDGMLRIATNVATTKANFLTWLLTHNTIIYYVLATPTYTKLTDTTLINQLENIYKNMLSYKGTTNISQVNNDLPFALSVSAIEDLEV